MTAEHINSGNLESNYGFERFKCKVKIGKATWVVNSQISQELHFVVMLHILSF